MIPATVKLRFLPANDFSRSAVVCTGEKPYLDLTLKSSKSWRSVLSHLAAKWSSIESVKQRTNLFFILSASGSSTKITLSRGPKQAVGESLADHSAMVALRTLPMQDLATTTPVVQIFYEIAEGERSVAKPNCLPSGIQADAFSISAGSALSAIGTGTTPSHQQLATCFTPPMQSTASQLPSAAPFLYPSSHRLQQNIHPHSNMIDFDQSSGYTKSTMKQRKRVSCATLKSVPVHPHHSVHEGAIDELCYPENQQQMHTAVLRVSEDSLFNAIDGLGDISMSAFGADHASSIPVKGGGGGFTPHPSSFAPSTASMIGSIQDNEYPQPAGITHSKVPDLPSLTVADTQSASIQLGRINHTANAHVENSQLRATPSIFPSTVYQDSRVVATVGSDVRAGAVLNAAAAAIPAAAAGSVTGIGAEIGTIIGGCDARTAGFSCGNGPPPEFVETDPVSVWGPESSIFCELGQAIINGDSFLLMSPPRPSRKVGDIEVIKQAKVAATLGVEKESRVALEPPSFISSVNQLPLNASTANKTLSALPSINAVHAPQVPIAGRTVGASSCTSTTSKLFATAVLDLSAVDEQNESATRSPSVLAPTTPLTRANKETSKASPVEIDTAACRDKQQGAMEDRRKAAEIEVLDLSNRSERGPSHQELLHTQAKSRPKQIGSEPETERAKAVQIVSAVAGAVERGLSGIACNPPPAAQKVPPNSSNNSDRLNSSSSLNGLSSTPRGIFQFIRDVDVVQELQPVPLTPQTTNESPLEVLLDNCTTDRATESAIAPMMVTSGAAAAVAAVASATDRKRAIGLPVSIADGESKLGSNAGSESSASAAVAASNSPATPATIVLVSPFPDLRTSPKNRSDQGQQAIGCDQPHDGTNASSIVRMSIDPAIVAPSISSEVQCDVDEGGSIGFGSGHHERESTAVEPADHLIGGLDTFPGKERRDGSIILCSFSSQSGSRLVNSRHSPDSVTASAVIDKEEAARLACKQMTVKLDCTVHQQLGVGSGTCEDMGDMMQGLVHPCLSGPSHLSAARKPAYSPAAPTSKGISESDNSENQFEKGLASKNSPKASHISLQHQCGASDGVCDVPTSNSSSNSRISTKNSCNNSADVEKVVVGIAVVAQDIDSAIICSVEDDRAGHTEERRRSRSPPRQQAHPEIGPSSKRAKLEIAPCENCDAIAEPSSSFSTISIAVASKSSEISHEQSATQRGTESSVETALQIPKPSASGETQHYTLPPATEQIKEQRQQHHQQQEQQQLQPAARVQQVKHAVVSRRRRCGNRKPNLRRIRPTLVGPVAEREKIISTLALLYSWR